MRDPARPEWRKWLRKKYGIDGAEWHTMLIAQDGRCGICAQPMIDPRVDHDHRDGRVRGLLCDLCNRGIGMLRDSPEHLASAIRYLS